MLFLQALILFSATLLWPSILSAIVPDPEGPSRPYPSDSEDGYQYTRVGSYYHGDLKLKLQIANVTDTEYEYYNGTVCKGFRTIEVEYQKSTLLLGRPLEANNPLAFSVFGLIDDQLYNETETGSFWNEKIFYLTFDKTGTYSDKGWNISAGSWDEAKEQYSFNASQIGYVWTTIAFDFNAPCASNGTTPTFSPGDNDDGDEGDPYQFTGTILHPDNDEIHGWDSIIPIPSLNGSFNDREANFKLSSAFKLNNGYFRDKPTVLFGSLRVSFEGKIDSKWSDDLLLEEKAPKWNATVGMDDPNAKDEEDGGSQTMVNSILAYSFVVLAIGMFLV